MSMTKGTKVALTATLKPTTAPRTWIATITGTLNGEPREVKERVLAAIVKVSPSLPGAERVSVGLARKPQGKRVNVQNRMPRSKVDG